MSRRTTGEGDLGRFQSQYRWKCKIRRGLYTPAALPASFAGLFVCLFFIHNFLPASLLPYYLPVFMSCRWQVEGRPNQSPTVSFDKAPQVSASNCRARECARKKTQQMGVG